jgi:phosphatidate phosphatase APP1
MGAPDADGFARYEIPSCGGESHSGEVQLLTPDGVSVVSTIDDTIKKTGVENRMSAASNTLLFSYQAIGGMPRLYQAWRTKGTAFHYVSGVPRELYRSMARFLNESGYPKGSVHLREWNMEGGSVLDKIDQLAGAFSDEGFKRETINSLIEKFPTRRFVLVGNARTNDPEIFGEIARLHPDQVRSIFILDEDRKSDVERLRAAFQELPESKWKVFRNPAQVTTAL